MRSRTSRGVPEWSGGKDLYIGSPVSAIGTSFGVIGIVPGPPEGSRGPTGWGHLPRGATWAVGGAPWPTWAKGGAPAHYGLVPLPTSALGALRDGWPHPVDPRDPFGGPGTIPMTLKLVPMAEIGLPIYKSLPPDHSGTPRDVRDLIRDSKQHSVTTYKLPL